MDKRTLMAIVFAILIMMGYSSFMQKYYPAPKQAVTQASNLAGQKSGLPEPVASVGSNLPKFTQTDFIKLSTEDVDYYLSEVGGCIKFINIKKFNKLEKNEVIYDAEFIRGAVFSLSGFSLAPEEVTSAKYKYSKTQNGAVFTLNLKNGLEISKVYKLNNGNVLDLEVKIKNTTASPIKTNYSIVGISNIKIQSPQDARFMEASLYINNKRTVARMPKMPDSTGNNYIGNIDWAAMQSKYFSIVIKPYQQTVSSTVSKLPNNNVFIDLQYDINELAAGETISQKFLLYAGPADVKLMATYNVGIEKSVNIGMFGDISRLLIWILNTLYNITRNYGIAIILLAILVSIILYPLTLKSFKSMKQMQIVQPKMEKLRKEYKDNPQKLNKEIMELYKKHKVNPFGGCLPMLLQMPIFIALYQAFIRAIELRDARFLWIKDLSQPDRAFFIPSGTGNSGIPVNILPILMAITMYFQQKVSMAASIHPVTDGKKEDVLQQQQKMMTIMMPILFGFIFYNMPSGLVLYWFVNTLIMFYQQTRVMKSFHVETMAEA